METWWDRLLECLEWQQEDVGPVAAVEGGGVKGDVEASQYVLPGHLGDQDHLHNSVHGLECGHR